MYIHSFSGHKHVSVYHSIIQCTFLHCVWLWFCSDTEFCCVCVHLSPSSTNTEPSLTLHNLNIALDTLPDRVWDGFGVTLSVPLSQLSEIRSQYSSGGERISALLHTYLTSHPAPSWQRVADALYILNGGVFHTVLGRVQRMFPTGKKMHYCHIHVHVSHSTVVLCI